MKLMAKFNVMLLVVFGAGGLIVSLLAYNFLISNARREVLAQAQLMVASAKAVRDYTADDLSPLLQQNSGHKFLVETVPFYAAASTLSRIRKSYPEYANKEDQYIFSCNVIIFHPQVCARSLNSGLIVRTRLSADTGCW